MYIEEEIDLLKKEIIEKTDSAFRVVKKTDAAGEHIVAFVEEDLEEKIDIKKEDYLSRIIICRTKLGYLSVFYP